MSHRTPPHRVAAVAGAAAAVRMIVAVAYLASGSASAGTVSGSLYRDPNSAVVRWVAANPNDSRMPVIRDKIASQPQAHWLSSFNLATVTSEVSTLVSAANAASSAHRPRRF